MRGLIPLLLVVVLLAGCGWNEWKEEYRGVDLITDRGLSTVDFADAYIGGTTPAFDYVNYEEISDSAVYGGITGLPGTPGSVYRLELVNLMPNGDFELVGAGQSLDAFDPTWTIDGSVTLEGNNTAGVAINGMSAYFDVVGNEAAFFNLRTGLLDSLVHPGSYHLNLFLRRATALTRVNFDYGSQSFSFLTLDNIIWESDSDPDNPDLDVETFPNDTNINVVNIFSVADDPEHYFYFGAPNSANAVNSQQGYVDDIRIGRHDILPHVALPLGPSVLDGSMDILPGLYQFSVYVKCEIDSQVTPLTVNAFRACQITLGINDLWATTSIEDGGWSSTEWAQVSFQALVRSSDLADDDVMTLRMTVSSNDTPMIGRILIADPKLELVVN
jgi:hypothetical protein